MHCKCLLIGDKADIVFPFIRDNNREFFGFDVLSTQLQASKELTLQGFMLVIPCEIETGIFCREPGYFGPSQREILARKREIWQETGNSRNAMLMQRPSRMRLVDATIIGI